MRRVSRCFACSVFHALNGLKGLKRQAGNLSTYQVHDIFLVWGGDAPNPFRGIYPAPLCRPSRPGKNESKQRFAVWIHFYLLQLETLLYLEAPSWKPRHVWNHQAGIRVMFGKIQPLKRLATPTMYLTAHPVCAHAGAMVLERANAWSETADPEGRQAEWNGAFLRSKIKRGYGPGRPGPEGRQANVVSAFA